MVSHFRFGFNHFGRCGCWSFRNWAFDAFDGEEWSMLCYDSGENDWTRGRPVVFPVNPRVMAFREPFASSRFRLRLAIGPNHGPNGDASDVRHMHVRGLEVFGTILPPWRL